MVVNNRSSDAIIPMHRLSLMPMFVCQDDDCDVIKNNCIIKELLCFAGDRHRPCPLSVQQGLLHRWQMTI